MQTSFLWPERYCTGYLPVNYWPLVFDYAGHLSTDESDYNIGESVDRMYGVLVHVEGNRRLYTRARNIGYSYRGKTLQQVGVTWARWTGVFEINSAAELRFLHYLYTRRVCYFCDKTLVGMPTPTAVYWAGDFAPQFYDLDLRTGYVPFDLIQVSAEVVGSFPFASSNDAR